MKDRKDISEPAPTRAASSLRILVVDDDRVTYRLVSGLLERQGYEVDTADGGAKALELLEAHFYDLVLLDVEMPGMDGLEVAGRIRSLPTPMSAIPIVGLTAHEMREEKGICLRAGMDGVMSKPIRAQELFRSIERWLKFPGREKTDSPRAKVSARPPVDLQEAAARCGNDMEFVAGLLQDFVSDGPRRLQGLQELAGGHEWVGLGKAAHQLKGAAGNLSACNLAELARRLEEFCRKEDERSVAAVIAEIREEFARLAGYTSIQREAGHEA